MLAALVAVMPLCAQKIAAIPRLNKVDIKLDGSPDEAFWQKVPEIRDFMRYGNPGVKITADTSVRICLDKENLYFALTCDEPVKVTTGTPGTGSAWSADGVEIFFGSLDGHDWLRQIVFALNDVGYYEFIREHEFKKAVKFTDKAWSAEMIIPLDKLGNMPGDKLMFNMFRHRVAAREMQTIADLQWANEMDKYMTLHIYTPADTVIYGPWNTQVRADSAVICWESAAPCRTSLGYREKGTEKYTVVFADIQGYVSDRSQKLHAVKLRNLKPGKVYEYVINDEVKGTFQTLDPADADFSFAACADTHGRSWEMAANFQKKHVQQADIFIHLGDSISGFIGRGSYYDGFLKPVCENWNKPFYVARGNHEGRGNAPAVFLDMIYPEGRKAYQGFLHKGVYFLFLDLSDEFNADPEFWEEQSKWLHETVQSKEFKNAAFRVLISHYALHLTKKDGKRLQKIFDSLPQEIRNSFDLALAGHHHCGLKILPGSDKVISSHPRYNGIAPHKKLPFLRAINFGGTFCVKKSADKLTVIRYDANGKVIDETVLPRKRY